MKKDNLVRLPEVEVERGVDDLERLGWARNEGDLLAIKYSLLESGNPELEKWGLPRYLLAWPVMCLLSAWVMIKHYLFLLIKRPKQRLDQLLGPEQGTIFFDQAHPLGHWVRRGVTSWVALDVIYSLPVAIPKPRGIGEYLLHFWLDQPDGQAVRNRLRLTYQIVKSELERLAQERRQTPIRILSLACGSAQAVIEALAQAEKQCPESRFELCLVDASQEALNQAKTLAQAREVKSHIEYEPRSVTDKLNHEFDASWDIVETVGFFDYPADAKVAEKCLAIKRVLKKNGLLITAMISRSLWAFAVRWVINWPLLLRRRRSRIERILLRAFKSEEIEFKTEPWGIHHVVCCRRLNGQHYP